MFCNILKLVVILPVIIQNCLTLPVGEDPKVNFDEEINLKNKTQQINTRSAENQELETNRVVNPALIPQQYEYLRQQQPSYSENLLPIQQYPQSRQQPFLDIQQSQYPGIQQSQSPVNLHQSQYPINQQSQYPVNQQSQYPGISQSQYPGISQSQNPGNQQYGYPEAPRGYPEMQQGYPVQQQQQPEWYTGLNQGYPSPQQSVYPSNPFPESLTCSYSTYRASGDLCGLQSYPQYCRYKNPCVLNPGKYLKVIGNSRYFIQCDNSAGAYCKSCGPATVWDQDLYTCNYPTASNY